MACMLLGLHVFIAISSLLLPAHYSPLKLITFYRKHILVGPFFQDERIKYTSHLYVSYLKDGKWSLPHDYAYENFIYYTQHPWRYDKLHEGDYEAYAAWSLSEVKASKVHSSKAFRELNQYVTAALIKRAVDSVSIVYLRKHYQPETDDFRMDTLFVYQYDPGKVHAGKKLD